MQLSAALKEHFPTEIKKIKEFCGELTLEIASTDLLAVSTVLRDEPLFDFKLLIDVCGVDYLHYGLSEWQTTSTTLTGFSRGVEKLPTSKACYTPSARFAVVYHLLSLTQNQRLRLCVFLPEEDLMLDSVIPIWPAANWFEREAFDLFGIIFKGHPDLRRLLSDYGFIGHPFRKDFPLIGNVEVRYDAELKRVIYEPVSIQPRILEPKVIRHDSRYNEKAGESPL